MPRLIPLLLLAVALPTALPAQGTSRLDDPTIIAIFDLANTADIETGDLAAARGHDKQVREMGRNFAAAHKGVRALGRELAQRLGVTPTPPADRSMANAHAEALARLQQMTGNAFDRAYVAHEVAFHRAVIEAVTTQLLPAIQNPELRALVEKVAPAFQAHLKGAETLLQSLES